MAWPIQPGPPELWTAVPFLTLQCITQAMKVLLQWWHAGRSQQFVWLTNDGRVELSSHIETHAKHKQRGHDRLHLKQPDVRTTPRNIMEMDVLFLHAGDN